MTEFGVHSEVGKLRKVMVHRPDLSLQRLTPSNHDELLFDDVLWVERAQYEHDQFVARMRERGVEVFLLSDLLAEALAASDEARQRLIELVASEYTVGWSLVDEIRSLLADLKPDQLAKHLIGGLTVAEAGLDLADGRQGLADRRRARRPEHLRAAAAAEHAVHPRLVVLDLRRRVDQPDVLAGPAPRGVQRGRDLQGPPDVRRRRLRVLVPARGARRPLRDRRLRAGLDGGRRRDADRQRRRADRHERAHPGPDDRADRQGAVRQGRRRAGDRLRDDQGPRPHAPRHRVHAARPGQGDRLPEGRPQHPGGQPAARHAATATSTSPSRTTSSAPSPTPSA